MNDEYSLYQKPDKKLMKLFLECPDYVRRVVITDNQVSIIEMMNRSYNGSITASDLANHRDISIQSASTQMANLWRTGYVERRAFNDETGGMKYRYKVAI